MTAPRYRIFSIPIPDALVRDAEDGTVVIDRDDEPIVRWRTETCTAVPTPRRSA